MARQSDARQRMIKSTARLFRRQGFHGTGLQQVLEASGAPRGSLYFHFPGGKEEIGETALTIAGELCIYTNQNLFVEVI